jgi:Ohr subfamily peroxiredoxin
MTMTQQLVFTGTTRTTSGPDGAARSIDGRLDIKMPEPHPVAEDLFAAAWSGCFLGAVQLAALQKKIALPASPSVETTIDLLRTGSDYNLRAKLDVSVPGLHREIAQDLIEAAHKICPYSKAIAGNIDVELTLAA